ncbi:MAG TPA: hypothetical protein VJ301_18855 [Propionibacteriaceae bacterium]|nr:hypothetical protein [Propionibacteriaceae bacterium]
MRRPFDPPPSDQSDLPEPEIDPGVRFMGTFLLLLLISVLLLGGVILFWWVV